MRWWWWVAGALCAVALASSPAAADEIGAPFSLSPAELQELGAGAVEPGTPAVVLWEEVRYVYDEAGRRTWRMHKIYELGSRGAAEGWGEVSVSWAPWHQERPRLRARVVRPGGRAFELDPRTISSETSGESSAHVYSDWRALRAPLPGASPGAVVEVELEVVDREPFFAAGTVERFVFGYTTAPVRRSRLVVDLPAGKRLRHSVTLLPELRRRVVRRGDRRLWIFEHGALDPVETESSLPADEAPFPSVAFTTGRSWRQVAAAYAQAVDQRIAAGPPPAAALPEPGATRAETVARALAHVHRHVRYTGLELGQNALVPWTPAQTWSRGYGDCKDKATLLVAILRRLGIDAHVALLDSGFDYDVDPRLPGVGEFDHAVVVVEGSPPIWIDATVELARPGLVPRSVQGRWALVARRGTKRLTRVPAAGHRDNRILEERRVRLSSYGEGGRVIETSHYTGTQELAWRYEHRGLDRAQVAESFAQYAKSEYGAELVSHRLGDPEDLSTPYTITLEMEGYSETGTHWGSVFIGAWGIAQLLPAELTAGIADDGETAPPPRKRPLALTPHSVVQRYRVSAPPGFVPAIVPTTRHTVVGPLRLRRDVRRAGGEVIVEIELAITGRRATPRQVAAMRAALERFANEDRPEVRFENAAMMLADRGKLAEAAAMLERLAAAHPGDADQRARLSLILRLAGLNAEARLEAERAVRADPDSRLAHIVLGEACESGPLGRPYGRGLDRACALAAYRRALELEPEDVYARSSLGQLLARDELGRSLEGDLAAALPELRKAVEVGGKEQQGPLVAVLAASGRWAELLALEPELGNIALRDSARIAAIAAERGAAAAASEVRRLPAERREQSALAGLRLLLSGRAWQEYALLARALRRDGIAIPVPDAVLDRLLRSPRRAGPERAGADFFAALAAGYGPDDPQMHAVLASSARRNLVASPDWFWRLSTGLRTSVEDGGVRTLAMAEFMRAAHGASAQELGAAEDARWLRLTVFGRQVEGVVIRERGRWKWLADPTSPGLLGEQALAYARARRWAEARVLLDAARSNTAGSGPWRPFGELWTAGQRGSPEAITAAAAALAAMGPNRSAALAALRRCARSKGERGAWCAEAAGTVLWREGQLQKALAAHQQALRGGVPADAVDMLALAAHLEAGRSEQAEPILRKLATSAEGRAEAAQARALAEGRAGRLESAQRLFEQALQGDADADAGARNMWAWLELFGASPDLDAALEHARKAMAAVDNEATRNTVAAVMAARGDIAGAVELLREQLDSAGPLRPADWLVYGRIAAACGRLEAARRAYDRAIADPSHEAKKPYSAAELARRWRAELPAP